MLAGGVTRALPSFSHGYASPAPVLVAPAPRARAAGHARAACAHPLTARLLARALAGKVHGSLARAGKVRGQTPKVAKATDKKKKETGRAKKRLQYNRRFVNVVVGVGKKKGPNTQPLGKMG